jgi:hypothetical protein
MAEVVITGFSLEIPGTGQITFKVTFSFNLTATEARLEVPSHVWGRVMQRKGSNIDPLHLFADAATTHDPLSEPIVVPAPGGTRPGAGSPAQSGSDVRATGWEYAGLFASAGTYMFTITKDVADLPSSASAEDWYIVLVARPDVTSAVALSNTIHLNAAATSAAARRGDSHRD